VKVGDQFIVNSRHGWRIGDKEGQHRFKLLVKITELNDTRGTWERVEVLEEEGAPPVMAMEAPHSGGWAQNRWYDLIYTHDYEPLSSEGVPE
jgi:hypothetical protein